MKVFVAEIYEGVGAFVGLAAEMADLMRTFFDKAIWKKLLHFTQFLIK